MFFPRRHIDAGLGLRQIVASRPGTGLARTRETPVGRPLQLLLSILAASFVAAFICWAGGAGGLVVLRIRAVERRVDGHDDDFESVRVRLARREGSEGRARQQAQKSSLEEEIAQVRAAQGNGARKRLPAAEEDREVQLVMEAWSRDAAKGDKS